MKNVTLFLTSSPTTLFQITIATTLGELVTDIILDPIFEEDYNTLFSTVGQTLSVLLSVPKSAQLRSKTVEVTAKVMQVFFSCNKPDQLYLFKREILQPIDDVIKDLGGEAASKDAARQIKVKLGEIKDLELEEDQEMTENGH